MKDLICTIKKCALCAQDLPLEPKPIVTGQENSKIIIISQAPGIKAHRSGIAWNDKSGKRLRQWLHVSETDFYNSRNFAVLPMGFCYPGKAKTGDLPPQKICAPTWHSQMLNEFTHVELVLLIGAYAQKYYLKATAKQNLTETVGAYKTYLPKYFPMPHPSPTNRFWLSKNPWFETLVVPKLQKIVADILVN